MSPLCRHAERGWITSLANDGDAPTSWYVPSRRENLVNIYGFLVFYQGLKDKKSHKTQSHGPSVSAYTWPRKMDIWLCGYFKLFPMLVLLKINYYWYQSRILAQILKLSDSRPPSDSVVQAYGKLFQHMARYEPKYNYHGDNHMFCPDKKYNWLFT